MIKVLYDYQIFSMQQYGGISRYFANLHENFDQGTEVRSVLGVVNSKNYYLKSTGKISSPFLSSILSNHKITKWNKRYCDSLLQKNNFDLFHPTYYHPYFLNKLKRPLVLTVHDMIHEILPEYFPASDEFSRFKRILIERADHLIAISESTKNDVQKVFNVPDEKISVVYHGYHKPQPSGSNTFFPPFDKYILFVGERSSYKNFFNFIKGITPFLHADKKVNLICAGGGSFGVAEQELLHRNKIQDRVNQIKVTDAELATLYKKAIAFVFPSMYEGFGFPILEAFANNCPVIVSNGSCFKEIAGNAALYFDLLNPHEISDRVATIINNPDIANELRQSGAIQLAGYTMEKCIDKTAEVYKKIVAKN